MIQFLGLHVDDHQASTIALGRDLECWAETTAPVENVIALGDSGIREVAPLEWTRAACYALEETYLHLPTKARKVWGLAVTAPSGWIALGFDYEPLSRLRFAHADKVASDFAAWRQNDARVARRVAALLTPKDYIRFVLSGSLATDVTDVDRMNLLEAGTLSWSEDKLRDVGLDRSIMPPIFDSHVMTGRLSEDGVRKSGIPGGICVVAGAHEEDCALAGVADVCRSTLWRYTSPSGEPVAALGFEGVSPISLPPAWKARRAALEGFQVAEWRGLKGGAAIQLAEAQASLKECERPCEDAVDVHPNAPLGAAALAAVGSGLVKGWDPYYEAFESRET